MSTVTKIQKVEKITLPALALRGLVIFPGTLLQFDVGRKKSVLALEKSMEDNQLIFLVAQKDLGDNDPDGEEIYSMGVVARIKQIIRRSDEGVRLFAEGLYRAQVTSIVKEEPFFLTDLTRVETTSSRSTRRAEALIRYTQNLFEQYIQNYSHIPPDIVIGVVQKKDCGELADYIASNIMFDYQQKQEILEELSRSGVWKS